MALGLALSLAPGWMLASGAPPAAGPAPAAELAPAAGSAFALGGPPSPSIPWVAGFDQALEQAEILRRPMMIDIWAKWCGWCHELDRRTYSDREVVRRAQAMTCAKVNADQEREIGRRFRVRGLPTILFLDRHGQEIDRINGFVHPAPFAQGMDDVLAAADRAAARGEELRREPRNPVKMYALADELIAQGRLAEAEPLLSALTPAGTEAGSTLEPGAVLDLAVVRQGVGDRDAARRIFAGFLDAYPDSPRRLEAELRLGGLLAEIGAVNEARDHLQAVAAAVGEGKSWKAAEAHRLLELLGQSD